MSTGLGIGIGTGMWRTTFDSVAADYFSRAGITDSTEKYAINRFVQSCKSNTNIWNALQGGAVYLVSPTSYGASLHNLLSSDFTITTAVAPTFSTNGWSFNGTTQYLDTGINAATVLTLNQGFVLLSARSYTAGASVTYGASDAGNTNQWQCSIKNASNNSRFNAYNSATVFDAANAFTSGTYVFGITANNARYIRRNGASLGTSTTVVGGGLPPHTCYIGARNLEDVASNFAACELNTVIQGLGALSAADSDTLRTYVDTYNATVISGGR